MNLCYQVSVGQGFSFPSFSTCFHKVLQMEFLFYSLSPPNNFTYFFLCQISALWYFIPTNFIWLCLAWDVNEVILKAFQSMTCFGVNGLSVTHYVAVWFVYVVAQSSFFLELFPVCAHYMKTNGACWRVHAIAEWNNILFSQRIIPQVLDFLAF